MRPLTYWKRDEIIMNLHVPPPNGNDGASRHRSGLRTRTSWTVWDMKRDRLHLLHQGICTRMFVYAFSKFYTSFIVMVVLPIQIESGF